MSTPIAVLANNLPWTQRLGRNDQSATTAIDRVEHHLAKTIGGGPNRRQAAELLQRRREMLERYRALTADQNRSREPNDRGHDLGYGLDR
jgi:hypothetical protein